jgi:non-ribosomal peptide synthase protein (TIGR01720 family)
MYPAAFQVELKNEPFELMEAVVAQYRAIPRHGIGYGMLRYLVVDEEIRRQCREASQPEVSFNYLGQFDAAVAAEHSWFKLATTSGGVLYDPRAHRAHPLELNGLIVLDRLQFSWCYSGEQYREATIAGVAQQFMQHVRRLIAEAIVKPPRPVVPPHLARLGLSQADLMRLSARVGAR